MLIYGDVKVWHKIREFCDCVRALVLSDFLKH